MKRSQGIFPEIFYMYIGQIILEAAPGFEPGMKDLQSSALPLGYAATKESITIRILGVKAQKSHKI